MTVVPFPRPPLEPARSPLRDGHPMTRCLDPVHVFATPSGRCQCGDHLWGEPSLPVGVTPDARIEGPA